MNQPKHVLIVGVDVVSGNALSRALASDGEFHVTEAATGADVIARTQAREQQVHAIIVYPDAADAAGSRLCAWLRRHGLRVPIIVLSAGATEQDVVRALDAGANDHVVRPARVAELKARLRAHMGQHDTSEDVVFPVGPYYFRPGARSLHERTENRHIRLTQQEVAILKHLYRAGGRPISGPDLLQGVWRYSGEARSRTVETHIYRLRRKIEPNPSRPYIIVKDRGGYRLAQQNGAGVAVPAQAPLPFRT
jgi:DNA-binding response OmpR family regulator